jgi:hypothetical protein
MSINSKLHEHFVRLPKLNPDGTNYIVYRDRFGFATEASGLGAVRNRKYKRLQDVRTWETVTE